MREGPMKGWSPGIEWRVQAGVRPWGRGRVPGRGTWAAAWAKHPTLDLSSGLCLGIASSSPKLGFKKKSGSSPKGQGG